MEQCQSESDCVHKGRNNTVRVVDPLLFPSHSGVLSVDSPSPSISYVMVPVTSQPQGVEAVTLTPVSPPPGSWTNSFIPWDGPLLGVHGSGCGPSISQLAPRESDVKANRHQSRKRNCRGRRNRGELRLAECLEVLEPEDPDRILRLTGMAKLGPDVVKLVKHYFEDRYGQVDQVLLANRVEERSIMGFLVMFSAEAVGRALFDGELHEVQPGVCLKIRSFQRRPTLQ